MSFLPLAAGVVSALFALFILQQFVRKRRPYQLVWVLALLMFAVASFAAARGIMEGWSPGLFRIYYLFGAIVNVPVLGLGTIYLLAPRTIAHVVAVLIGIACIYAGGAVFSAEINQAPLIAAGRIPPAAKVMPDAVRTLSRYLSFTGFAVVLTGALWSAWRLSRKPDEHFRRLTKGNVLIAAGTAVVAIASSFARRGQGEVFAVGLLFGITIMFAGFLTATRQGALPTPLQPDDTTPSS